MSAKLRKPVSKRPFYISDSEEINGDWAIQFDKGVQAVGPNYGISQAELDKVKAAALVIATFMGRLKLARIFLDQCITCKDAYFNNNPEYPQAPVSFAVLPEIGEAPAELPPNILKVFIEVAEAILLKNPSEADRILLGLVPAKSKPVPPNQKQRAKASDKNYPQLKYTIKGDTILLSVKRGEVFRGKMLRIIVDKEGHGVFVEMGVTNKSEFKVVYSLPTGILTGAWAFKGIFMEGQDTVGGWSPELVVPLVQIVQPIPAESLNIAIADLSTESVVTNGQPVSA